MVSRATTLTILDVGHGNSAVLMDAKGTLVIDAGPRSALLEYLTEAGLDHIDVVFVSHADRDHINGLIGLLSSGRFTFGKIRLNTDSSKGSDAWNDLLWELEQRRAKGQLDCRTALAAGSGDDFSCGAVDVEVLAPSAYLTGKGPGGDDRNGRKITSNSISAIIRLRHGDTALAVFAGDIDEVGIENILEQEVKLNAKTLVFPHHGGNLSRNNNKQLVQRFLKIVSPTNIIFSIGRGLHSTPQPDIVEAIREAIPNIYIACTQLSEHCADRAPKAVPAYVEAIYAAGREKRVCCAGSIRLDPRTGDIISPAIGEHVKFIVGNVPTPLCK